MGCCGGGNKRIRKQIINRPDKAPKQAVVHRVKKRSASTAQPMRQRVRTSQKCESCGFPTMLVNIAGRERAQCTNTGCRKIAR